MGILPPDMTVLPPCDDRVFKLLLTSPEAIPTLRFVSSALIHRPVQRVLVRNNELPVADTEEKAQRFDVNCLIDDDTQTDIEMQSSRMEEKPGSDHANIKARSIYYVCDLHSSQKAKGKPYHELARTYQVMFCGYTVFPKRMNYINTFSMRHDEDNELFLDSIRVVYIELSKLERVLQIPVEQMTDMERFSVFLRYAGEPDCREIVNKVLASKEELAVAGDLLMGISKDERERAIFRSRLMYQNDLESNLATAKSVGRDEGIAEGITQGLAQGLTQGIAQGITQGKAEGLRAVAKGLLNVGDSIEKIALVTGLSRHEVESIRDAT